MESKKRIKESLIKEEESKVNKTETLNLPISSILKVSTSTYNRKFESLDESVKNELKPLLSLSKDDLKDEMDILKMDVVDKLSSKIKESKEQIEKNPI